MRELVLVFSSGRPLAEAIALVDGQVELGREHPIFRDRPDPRMSRRHALVRLEGERLLVSDLDSRNGTWVDGRSLRPHVPGEVSRVIRTADSVFVPGLPDDRPEAIAWLVHDLVRRSAPSCSVHATLVEACMLRPWPGNEQERMAELEAASRAALAERSAWVEARHLGE